MRFGNPKFFNPGRLLHPQPASGHGGRELAETDRESDDAELYRLLIGYRISLVLYVAAKLKIADRLVSGPKDARALAAEAHVNADRLFRLLRALVSFGVLTMDGSQRFSLTPKGQLLRADVPHSLTPFALLQGEESYRAWGDLLHAVTTGETAFDHVYGMGQFEFLARNPEANATFNSAMAFSSHFAGYPFHGFDFNGHRVVVDVGGGSGALIASVLVNNPGLRGIIYDLPAAVVEAPARLSSLGVSDRCEIRTGSAFEAVPAGGDVYILSRVLHDFPDESATVLLRNCRKAMRKSGVLLLREGVMPEGPAAPNRALLDLQMMVMNGGRERTESEWRSLLSDSGFAMVRILLGAQNQDVIVAHLA